MTNILIIEDEPQVRANLREILTLNDFTALTAPDGQAGLLAAQDALPDLILCDLTMPELDGYGVLKGIRDNTHTQHIPIIFLTAHADRPDLRYAMELGAADYLTKPCMPRDLLKAINTQLTKATQLEARTNQKLDHLRSSLNLALPQELHTPLNNIVNIAEALLSKSPLLDSQTEQVRQIRTSGLRLHHLIHNYLLYAELEMLAVHGSASPPSRNFTTELRPTITSTAQRIAQNHNRSDQLHLDLENADLAISELKLTKIVEELIDNAFKFSTSPVHIFGRTLLTNHYQLDIIDSGQGMTPDQILSIGGYMQFDRHRYEQQGAGLGLIIAKRLTELNNGHLTIKSDLYCETMITITLPCSP
jgi:two-component system, sensor histidine kinase and response regulator